jgi:acetyl esterase/lipase
MKKYSALVVASLFSVSMFSGCSSGYTVNPSVADVRYGPHDRNTFDLWKAESTAPTPLVIYFHGGGFNSGTKERISMKLVESLLASGVSVISANYRLTPEVVYPDHYMDCARVVQFARYHAQDFNIDPGRIGAAGSSAGACTALWIAFHNDLADPKNADSVLQMSTRLSGVAMFSGQSTLDPAVISEWFGDIVLKHSFFKGAFFGLTKEEMNTQHGLELIRQASPITHLTRDDPSVWAYYSVPNVPPANVSEAVHHYKFGEFLKNNMEKVGVQCVVLDHETIGVTKYCVDFFLRIFTDEKVEIFVPAIH